MVLEVLIIFAQKNEAKSTVERLEASYDKEEHCYRFDQGRLVISGVGIYAAQMAVAKYARECDEIWNIGFAGLLQGEFPICQILPIKTVGKYIPLTDQELINPSLYLVDESAPNFLVGDVGGRLVSSDFAIKNIFHRDRLSFQWDLVDMEGYGVAFAANYLRKKCRIWKIVSDFASKETSIQIKKNQEKLSTSIADLIIQQLLSTHPMQKLTRVDGLSV